MEDAEDLSDLMPSPWTYINGALGHVNSIMLTAFCVLALVVGYILYIIHLYDSGKLGGQALKKTRGRKGRMSAAERIAEERWAKKNL